MLGIDRNKINKAQQFQIKKFPNEMIYAMLDYFEPGSNEEEVISYYFVSSELNFKALISMIYSTHHTVSLRQRKVEQKIRQNRLMHYAVL